MAKISQTSPVPSALKKGEELKNMYFTVKNFMDPLELVEKH